MYVIKIGMLIANIATFILSFVSLTKINKTKKYLK